MKKMIVMVSAFLIAGRLFAAGIAKQAQSSQAETGFAAKDAAAVKTAVAADKKAVQKAGVPASQSQLTAVTPASQVPAPTDAAEIAAVPQSPQAETAAVAPALAAAPVKPAAARLQACPGCFQPLLEGYNGIIADLKPWMEDMEAQAEGLDRKLSEIQKRINEKDDAIEKAKTGTDKKEAKAVVKSLHKERKTILKEYTGTSDKKDEFYKKFSKEAEKKMKDYNKIVAMKLQMTLSAASR